MQERIKTHISYRCPECTDAIFGLVGKYALRADMLRLKCGKDDFSLDLRLSGNGKVNISAPCILCRQSHSFTISEELLFTKDILTLPCPYSSVGIVFIGDAEKISDELSRTASELSMLVSSFDAQSVHELQPEDMTEEEILPEPALYDLFRFALKNLEADGAVDCPCHSGDYDLRFFENKIQAYCKSCGAVYTFSATTPAVAEDYIISLDSLTLR